jgi:hypothetical protein
MLVSRRTGATVEHASRRLNASLVLTTGWLLARAARVTDDCGQKIQQDRS